jgi:hypothetical protein
VRVTVACRLATSAMRSALLCSRVALVIRLNYCTWGGLIEVVDHGHDADFFMWSLPFLKLTKSYTVFEAS